MLKHADVIAPLIKLKAAKNLSQHWTAVHTEAFELSKQLMSQHLLLCHPVPGRRFLVATDASDTGIAGVLYQEDDDGSRVIVDQWARVLNAAERNYSATKKELLAVKDTLQRFRYYLVLERFTLFTDHKALTFMLTQHPLNGMLTTWFESIFAYSGMTIEHLPGVLNTLPDALSRAFPEGWHLGERSLLLTYHRRRRVRPWPSAANACSS